ncbi:MAG: hypothetical protein M1832_006426 [Thelocarpon impressellum]|nr:MAG: hypothetical protein M1832_006426 [Thelocarpon impressellum]
MGAPKRVAIVGAGPAGLVAAKTLLHSHPKGTFKPIVFEQTSRLGGIWPIERDERDGLLDPEMPINLSRYSVSFSDLAWESVNLDGALGSDLSRQRGIPPRLPMFPRAWHVGKYLQAYAQRYLPEDTISLNSRVSRTVRENRNGRYVWLVELADSRQEATRISAGSDLADQSEKRNSLEFDHLIIASGFFSKPFTPEIPGLQDFSGRVIHSTQLRGVGDLLKSKGADTASTPGPGPKKHKIVVVGGSISGAETSSNIAFQRSNARNSPSGPQHDTDFEIINLTARPFWPLPYMVPTKPMRDVQSVDGGSTVPEFDPAPSFLPWDLCLYDLSIRPPGPVVVQNAIVERERAHMLNDAFRTLTGRDPAQSDMAEYLVGGGRDRPPYVAITDTYAEFHRTGDITRTIGRLREILPTENGRSTLKISSSSKDIEIRDVSALVLATGFEPHAALRFLPPAVLAQLGHDPTCRTLPLFLHSSSAFNPAVPDLGFVGFYKGPFWGVMEMQARFLGKIWAGDVGSDQYKLDLEKLEGVRAALRASGDIAQFIMGDFSGLVETFAETLNISRGSLGGSSERSGPAVPARYPDGGSDPDQVETIMSSLEAMLDRSYSSGSYVARAVFYGLQGRWHVSRDLRSDLDTYPSGKVIGVAWFHPRQPTDTTHDAEYLYCEEGELTTDTSLKMQVSRRYVYRYDEAAERVSTWFVEPGDGKSVDYPFHELQFTPRRTSADQPGSASRSWSASGYHLCEKDEYHTTYDFRFRGAALDNFEVRYEVKGPKKDYTTATIYRR